MEDWKEEHLRFLKSLIIFVAVVAAVRYVIYVAGFDVDIPIVDPVLGYLMNLFGSLVSRI